MKERSPSAKAQESKYVPSAYILVPDGLLPITQNFGEPVFAPGESNITLSEFSARTGVRTQRVREQVGVLQSTNRLQQGLTPVITFSEGTLAQQEAGIAQVTHLVHNEPEIFDLVTGELQDQSTQFRPTRKQARQLVRRFVAARSEQMIAGDEIELQTDTITEMSAPEVISALWDRKNNIARSGDPVDVNFDRVAVLRIAEAVINGDDTYATPAVLEIYNAFTTGVLKTGTKYTSRQIREETGMSSMGVNVGLDSLKLIGLVSSEVVQVKNRKPYVEHVFTDPTLTELDGQPGRPENAYSTGSALLNELREHVMSAETASSEDELKRMAAVHLIDRVTRGRLFDSPDQSGYDYTSLLLEGHQRNALTDVFTYLEEGNLDVRTAHTVNTLLTAFPEDFDLTKRDAQILLTVGMVKQKSIGRAQPKREATEMQLAEDVNFFPNGGPDKEVFIPEIHLSDESKSEALLSLRERLRDIARPDDPDALRLDRMAVLKLAEAVLNDEDIYIPKNGLQLLESITSGDLQPGVAYTSQAIREQTDMTKKALVEATIAMRQVGMVTVTGENINGTAMNSYVFSELLIPGNEPASNSSGELTTGTELLQRLRDDIMSGERTDIVDLYRHAAAVHLIERAMQNGLFDPTDEACAGYTSLLLEGKQSLRVTGIFRRIENGDIDQNQIYSVNSLRKLFPDLITSSPNQNSDSVIDILRSVGILKYEKTQEKDLKKTGTDTFHSEADKEDSKLSQGIKVIPHAAGEKGSENNGSNLVLTEEMKKALEMIEDGEDDPRVLASVSGITGQEAYALLEYKFVSNREKSKEKVGPVTSGDLKEGQTITLPTGEPALLIARGGELYARYKDMDEGRFVHVHIENIAS